MRYLCLALLPVLTLSCLTARAEVISASERSFVLRHELTSSRSTDALWARLIDPSSWWQPDHTYSGDARNLSLDLQAGGLWLETWPGGAIAHGEVLLFQTGKLLRLSAPFGPLQGAGAHSVWTITITATDDGSLVVFDEVASGPASANLDELSRAVDFVKSEAISRLVSD